MTKATKILCAAAMALSPTAGLAEAQTYYGTGNYSGGGWQYMGAATGRAPATTPVAAGELLGASKIE